MKKNQNNQLSNMFYFNVIKKGVAVIALMVVALCTISIIYYLTITKSLNEQLQIKTRDKNEKFFTLEESSLVNKQQLDFFLKYTNHDELIYEKNLNIFWTITKELKYQLKYFNNCEAYNCFQVKNKFEDIPSALWKTLIGIEDIRFLDHNGIDFFSILRAIFADLRAMKIVQGASTITQQLAKNIFLSNEKSFERKIKELFYAYYLENNYSKEEILNIYFNEMEWGSINAVRIKGIQAASLFYLKKDINDVTNYESVILITMLKGPYYYHPLYQTQRLRNRVDVDYKKLIEKSLLFDKNDSWNEKQWDHFLKRLQADSEHNLYRGIWYAISENNNEDPYENFITQSIVQDILTFNSKKYPQQKFSVKFIKKDVYCDECQPLIFYSSYERILQDAIYSEKHQVGSLLKPLIYDYFIKSGYDWNNFVSTEPITFKLISGEWTPKEASQIEDKEITLEFALRKSRNIPIMRLANEVGFNKLEEYLLNYIPSLKTPLEQYPSQILGSIELSIHDLYKIYEKHIKENCKKDFVSALNILSEPTQTTISRVVDYPLKENKFFHKTGTSNSGLDNWFMAFDGKYLSIFWFGIDGDRKDLKLNLSGSSTSFKIYQQIVQNKGKRLINFNCEK